MSYPKLSGKRTHHGWISGECRLRLDGHRRSYAFRSNTELLGMLLDMLGSSAFLLSNRKQNDLLLFFRGAFIAERRKEKCNYLTEYKKCRDLR